MKTPSPKTRVIIIGLVVLVGIAVFIALYSHTSNDDPDTSKTTTASSTDQTVLSTTQLSRDHKQYANQKVSVQGIVIKTGSTYVITDTAKKGSVSFILDVSKSSEKPDSFFVNGSLQSPTPLTVTGTFHADTAPDGNISNVSIVADSIKK